MAIYHPVYTDLRIMRESKGEPPVEGRFFEPSGMNSLQAVARSAYGLASSELADPLASWINLSKWNVMNCVYRQFTGVPTSPVTPPPVGQISFAINDAQPWAQALGCKRTVIWIPPAPGTVATSKARGKSAVVRPGQFKGYNPWEISTASMAPVGIAQTSAAAAAQGKTPPLTKTQVASRAAGNQTTPGSFLPDNVITVDPTAGDPGYYGGATTTSTGEATTVPEVPPGPITLGVPVWQWLLVGVGALAGTALTVLGLKKAK